MRATYRFSAIGKKVSIYLSTDLRNTDLIVLGDFVTIRSGASLHAKRSSESQSKPVIVVGNHSHIARRCLIEAKNSVEIESDVLFSAAVLVRDHGPESRPEGIPASEDVPNGGKIRIGKGSWIGQGAAIVCERGELVIGRHCVIAANAVVTSSAPPFSVIFGNPARVVKHYDFEKGAWVLGGSRMKDA